jgi:hypothetical protein
LLWPQAEQLSRRGRRLRPNIFLAFSICEEEGFKLGIFVEKLATNTFIEELFFNFN